MVKVTDMTLNPTEKTVQVSLFADTKEDLVSEDISGVPTGYAVAFGSSCVTASGELAFMKSDGTWNWV